MKLQIVAVGVKLPDWAQSACDDYLKRFPPELKPEVKTVKTEARGSRTVPTLARAGPLRPAAHGLGRRTRGADRGLSRAVRRKKGLAPYGAKSRLL